MVAIKKSLGDCDDTVHMFEHMGEFAGVDQSLQREIEQARFVTPRREGPRTYIRVIQMV